MFLLIRMEYSKMKRKTAYLGMMAAAAILLGYIESLLPLYIGVPGVKLGISNLATVFVIYYYGTKEAALVSAVRILVVGFLFGNLFSILFSLAGAALSLLVMAGVKRIRGFSVFGVSMAGGIAHNVGQLIVAGTSDLRDDLRVFDRYCLRGSHPPGEPGESEEYVRSLNYDWIHKGRGRAGPGGQNDCRQSRDRLSDAGAGVCA